MVLQVAFRDWFWLILSILSTWRISVLICFEAGPFQCMTALRKVLYRMRLGSLIDCFHCTSFWIAIIISLLVYTITVNSILLAIAIAGGASILEKALHYGTQQQDPYTGDE